jgi:transforming growth factor-beta-induced protein
MNGSGIKINRSIPGAGKIQRPIRSLFSHSSNKNEIFMKSIQFKYPRLRVRFLTLFLVSATLSILSACDDGDDAAKPTSNIVQTAQSNSNLSTLVSALSKYPDLVSALSGNGTFTVFAPTNTAFGNFLDVIGQTSIDDIPEDVLKSVLQYHVISSASIESSKLTNTSVTTLSGEDIAVTVDGGVKLNGNSNVTQADVKTTNGVVHVVDAVLVPPSVVPVVGTVVAPAYFNKNFSTLIAAVKAASPSVLQALLTSGKKTLFAPTNAAFLAAGISTLPDQATLNAVLGYHVLATEIKAGDIASGSSSATTLQGSKLYLSKNASGVFINGTSKVTTADVAASNGVVHVIDRTLIPPTKTIAEIVTGYANASSDKQFTQLLAAVARTSGQGANDLLNAVSSPGDLTVFAPTDAAFQSLYTALGVQGVNDIPLSTLTAVLKHHVLTSRKFSTDLSTGAIATLNGSVNLNLGANPPTITSSSGTVANLVPASLNIHASNGVIHVIDKVLVPE